MKRLLLTTAIAVLLAGGLRAGESAEPKELTFSPAVETKPALKYKLLPDFLERRPGNAVPFYMRAFLAFSDKPLDDETSEKIVVWLDMPPKELPQDAVREVLGRYQTELGEVRLAVLREECLWDAALRERGQGVFSIILPEVQWFRSIARLLALQARLQIAEGDYDEAIGTLQVGLAMSRHIGRQPFLVSGLVAVAVADMMIDQLEELIAAEDAPNLYWSIAALPDPLIDWRPQLETESAILYLMFPELDGIENKEMTAFQWRQLWRSLFLQMGDMFGEKPPVPDGATEKMKRLARVAFADMLVEKQYPQARKSFLARGYDEKVVDDMSKAQVTLLDQIYTFNATYDDILKWTHVPYWEAREPLAKIQDDIAARRGESGIKALETFSVADMLVPALPNAIIAFQSPSHRLGALRTIEAIRLYSAGHDGELPRTLDDLKGLPLPGNPYTGKPAKYDFDAEINVATLTMSSPQDGKTLVYKLRIFNSNR